MTAPTRIDDSLFAHAKIVGSAQDRSAAQQINHWARLGAAVEDSRISAGDLADVLAGRKRYDDVDDFTQAAVRVAWDHELETRRQSLDMAAVLRAKGRTSWVGADSEGRPVTIQADAEG